MPSYEVLVFHRGDLRVLPITRDLSIGRDQSQDIQLEDTSVSREHARIKPTADGIVVEDLGSANGTILVRASTDHPAEVQTGPPAEPIATPTTLAEGDSVCIGAAMLVVRRNDGEVTPTMRDAEQLADRVAPTNISVLLLGETGAGKEVLSDRIHRASARSKGPFVKVHCAALTDSLLESELFGHEKGAFTGATKTRIGLIESAHGGTLMLDEVGDIPASTQVKLLRVVEEQRVQRVGGNASKPVDVRIVSATHRDLAEEVRAGRFRQDLYFRLNGITLRIPPLRDRRDEILSLAASFLPPTHTLSDAAKSKLRAHAWPGNIRELKQVVQRAVALTDGTIAAEHVLLDPVEHAPHGGLREQIAQLERKRIEQALERCGGNQTRAAKELGIPRRTLSDRLREWGLTKPRR